jgi:hypothetical protein
MGNFHFFNNFLKQIFLEPKIAALLLCEPGPTQGIAPHDYALSFRTDQSKQ